MNAFRIVLAVLALATGVFWIAIGAAIVADGNVYGWGGVLVGAGLGLRGWWIVRSLRIAFTERRAREAPPTPRDLAWPGGRARGLDWDGEPLPTVAERIAVVERYMGEPARD
jgi:membrane protease YdiL (CAAX protease family)